jgi:tetratricopeptide (TPR) repeat protein
MLRLAILSLTLATTAVAQSADAPKPLKLVMPQGPGAITFSITGDWQPNHIELLDNGTRPVIQLTNTKTNLDLSYLIFPNPNQTPTAEACRDSVIDPILANLGHDIKIENKQRSMRTLKTGQKLAIISYYIASAGPIPIHDQNVFGFLGDAHTCAEIHLSIVKFTPSQQPLFDKALDDFDADLSYKPTSFDYASLGAIFYNAEQNYAAAAPYYRRALDTAPAPTDSALRAQSLAYTRYLTDQLSMSYGISRDLKRSREVNEAAIAKDPDYPLYYYNLACADAEEGNASAARMHLEQAFARRANTIVGEHMPDPTQDSSILKLKYDKAFWTFVESLPKN